MAATPVTTFLLIRHAVHLLGGATIAGRMPGVLLSPAGHAQAAALADRLADVRIDALHCSPMERTQQTALPIAARCGVGVETCADLHEIDYGDWTGRAIDDLRGDERWRQWNSFRSGHRAPDGESMIEIQTRVVSRMMQLQQQHPDSCIALVSHGDVIKAATVHALGAPLDLCQRIEISPASVTVVVVEDHGPWVQCVNSTAGLVDLPAFSASTDRASRPR